MKLGLKNRLRLISLLPIFVLFVVTTYYAYNSFVDYTSAKALQNKLSQNKQLNDLVGNISRERGMTVIYLGNSSPRTLNSLIKQRKQVDQKSALYLSMMQEDISTHDHSNGSVSCTTCTNAKSIAKSIENIKQIRVLVDEQKTNFDDVYNKVYGATQHNAILQLESITKNQMDSEIQELSNIYISLVRTKESTAEERDLISFVLARSNALEEETLPFWISLIAKSEIREYDTLKDLVLIQELDAIFKDEENIELMSDINEERIGILSSSTTGEYELGSGIWFTMLSEKVNLISDAQELVLSAMDQRASQVQTDTSRILIISIAFWIVSIIIAILGYLLSNEIAQNIKNLENVLRGVAEDTKDTLHHNVDIDLQSTSGTAEAYRLLESIIQQTRDDKVAAQEASEAKSMFLANMSHEIRTPLNGIVGFTELLKDTGLEEEQNEFVEIIEKSSENLLEIINNILDLSKIESNKLEIEDIIFNPLEEFESAVEVYAVRASEKHIDLGCFIDPELEQPLKGDPTKIKEVVINLLSNAVKFTSSSGAINVNVLKVESEQAGITKVRFEVQDSGIGVTSEQKSRIFEAFSQADTSITRKYGGTGLGLTISSRFIELMGGQLDLESKPGEGTTFFFTIDFEEVETLNETSRGNYSNINALLLEDTHKSKLQAVYLKQYLDFYGVSYTTFKDPDELEKLQSRVDYDLLFVDYDYCSESALQDYAKHPQKFILLTKATYMRKLDSLNLDAFKILYEPLTNSKIKTLLESYHSQNFQAKQSKETNRKKFNANASKFHANVLIAEDNIINQKLIKRTLEDIGLTITIANNGLEAFQKRKDGNFDLVFMDIQMPFLDGVEATKEILEYEEDYHQDHVPIIALTANALKGDRERFLEAGLDEYTTKPLVRDEIISILNNFLSDHIVTDDEEINTESLTESTEDPEVNKLEEFSLTNDTSLEGTTDEFIKETQEEQEEAEEILQIDETPEPEIITTLEPSIEVQEEVAEEILQIDETPEPEIITTLEPSIEVQKEVAEEILQIDETPEPEIITTLEPSIEVQKEVAEEIIQIDEIPEPEIATTLEPSIEILEDPTYKADILVAKKSAFELKLFARLLDSLGYSYDLANSNDEIQNFVDQSSYKVILFDKECLELGIPEFAQKIKDSNEKTKLNTNLILVCNPSCEDNTDDKHYVQEIIENVVNKDLLKLVFQKFI